jgi:D-methionine transport system substrate-binding protein
MTRRRTRIATALLATATALALAVGVSACSSAGSGSSTSSAAAKPAVVKLGVHDASKNYWTTWQTEAKKQNIDLQIVPITDGQQLDQSVVDGTTDINSFQHIFYQAQFNVATNNHLVALAANYIYPMGIYSKKYKKISQIPSGSTVLVPNDATNQARALLVFQQAGLLKLKGGGSPLSTPDDVLPESKVKVQAVASTQVVLGLGDVAAGATTNNNVIDGGLDPKDALINDAKSTDADPYINIFTVRQKDANNPTLKKLVKIYQNSKEIQQQISDENGGILIDKSSVPQKQLQSILKKLEKQYATATGKSYQP